MIRIIGKIPPTVTVACAGGIDSMVFTHFLLQGKRKVNLAYFNHDTQHSQKAQKFIEKFADDERLNLVIGRVKGRKENDLLKSFGGMKDMLSCSALAATILLLVIISTIA